MQEAIAEEAASSRADNEADQTTNAAVDEPVAQKKRKERMSTAKELKMSRRKFEQLMGDPVRKRAAKKNKKEEDAARKKRTSFVGALLIGSRCLLLVPPSVL